MSDQLPFCSRDWMDFEVSPIVMGGDEQTDSATNKQIARRTTI